MARIIYADNRPTIILPKNKCDLKTLQEIVGGYIEIIQLSMNGARHNKVLIVDEEGLIKRKPINREATILLNKPPLFIVGDVVLAERNEIE